MILFRLISWPYIRKHAVRSLLTLAGIVIGVSVFFAMHAANESVFGAFQNTVSKIAGATELQITAGETGFPEEVLERVQSLSQVAVAAPVIEAVAGTGADGQGNLLILGVDLTGDRGVRDYQLQQGDPAMIDDPLVFLAQPDSIMVTSEYAARNQLSTGSRIRLDTASGPRQFTVRGELRSGGLSSAFGGNLAIMDIYAAQQVFGRGMRFDRIDIMLAKGLPLSEGETALRAMLGPGFQVQPPAARGQSFQSMLRIYNTLLNFSSAYALVIGMFIIYGSFSIAVAQRRKEIGILRALGATRRQIAILFLGESAVGGLIGSTVGVLVGYAAAGAITKAIGQLLEGVYGIVQGNVRTALSLPLVVATIGIGVFTSVVAGGVPARNAARVDPIQALGKGRAELHSGSQNWARSLGALAVGMIGAVLLVSTQSLRWFYAGYAFLIVAAVLLTPLLARRLAMALRVVLSWLRPVEGSLAADSLIGSAGQTASTIGALMLSVALVIGLAGTARASYDSIMGWVGAALNPDFFVAGSETLTGNNYRFPSSMNEELQGIDGISDVYRMRIPRVQFQGETVMLVVSEIEKLAAHSPPKTLAGNTAEMYRRTAAGQALIGSENLAALHHLKVGDPVELLSPGGVLRLPLAGIVREYSDQEGEIFLDRPTYLKYWGDDSVDHFRVFLKPGVDPAVVRSAILRTFSGNRHLFVLSNKEVRKYIGGLTDQWFAITWVQISIAILVAVLGIINSLTVTIADRRRELGILQAVGAYRSQVRLTIWLEAVGIAAIGLILGLCLGAVHLYYSLEITARDYPGLRFDYLYPYGVAALLFPIILIAGLLSATGPAEAAVRSSLVEALEYE